MQNEMDEKKVAEVIGQFYSPASIDDYDLVLHFEDFRNLFPEVKMPGEELLNKGLVIAGFNEESQLGEYFFAILR